MGEIRLFQICYEGELTVEVSQALRRLGAEPNFDQSWEIWLPDGRHAAALVRNLRSILSADARLLVAGTQLRGPREFVLVRHSLTPGADYTELHDALARLGTVLELPFESTFVLQTADSTDARTLGEALAELCPDESLMVTGITDDWAFCNSGVSRMCAPGVARSAVDFRTF